MLQQLKRGDLRQVQHVPDFEAGGSDPQSAVVAHAEIAHRVRLQRAAGKQKKQAQLCFHYNGPYVPNTNLGFMKRVITAQDIPASGEMRIPIGSIITPSARDVADARGVRLLELPADRN